MQVDTAYRLMGQIKDAMVLDDTCNEHEIQHAWRAIVDCIAYEVVEYDPGEGEPIEEDEEPVNGLVIPMKKVAKDIH